MLLLLIDVALTAGHGGRPLIDSWIYTGSDIVFCVQGVPRSICGMTIRSVSVTITNADGVAVTVIGTLTDDGWVGRFPASHFERFGSVVRGVCVRGLGRFGGEDSTIVLGIGGLHIKPGTAEVQPGAALKDAGASVKLHALTPEVTDATVTLKPVDGAVNYVTEPLAGMKPAADGGNPFHCVLDMGTMSFYVEADGMYYWRCDVKFDFVDRVKLNSVYYGETEYGFATVFNITVLEDLYGTIDELKSMEYPEVPVDEFPYGVGEELIKIPKGTVLNIIRLGPDVTADTKQEIALVDEDDNMASSIVQDPSGMDPLETGGFVSMYPGEIIIQAFYFDWIEGTIYFEVSDEKTYNLRVALPASASPTKARKFSLAVETDAESETAVEWQGGEVIEAAPGASNLVPGLTVWDVAEVAPGKFKVERASSPAQSAPLTLAAPNGRVAELTVDDDLVLEVKEV